MQQLLLVLPTPDEKNENHVDFEIERHQWETRRD